MYCTGRVCQEVIVQTDRPGVGSPLCLIEGQRHFDFSPSDFFCFSVLLCLCLCLPLEERWPKVEERSRKPVRAELRAELREGEREPGEPREGGVERKKSKNAEIKRDSLQEHWDKRLSKEEINTVQ